jgi:hypothetical protein
LSSLGRYARTLLVDNFGRHYDPISPHYRRPGEGRDPGELALRLDPGLRRDDDSMGKRHPRNNARSQGRLG